VFYHFLPLPQRLPPRCVATSGLLYCTRPCSKHRVPITLCLILVASDISVCLSKARCLAPAYTQRHCLEVPNAARNSPHVASRRLTQAYRVNRQVLMISCQLSPPGTSPSVCATYERECSDHRCAALHVVLLLRTPSAVSTGSMLHAMVIRQHTHDRASPVITGALL